MIHQFWYYDLRKNETKNYMRRLSSRQSTEPTEHPSGPGTEFVVICCSLWITNYKIWGIKLSAKSYFLNRIFYFINFKFFILSFFNFKLITRRRFHFDQVYGMEIIGRKKICLAYFRSRNVDYKDYKQKKEKFKDKKLIRPKIYGRR